MASDPIKADFSISAAEKLVGVVSKHLALCPFPGHGEYVSFQNRRRPTASGCPTCAQEARAAAERAEELAATVESLKRRLGDSLIPRRFAGKTFEIYDAVTPEQQLCLNTCRAYASDFQKHKAAGRCVVMTGTPGTGKTHLAAATAQAIMAAGETAVFRTVSAILMHIKGAFDKSARYTEADAYAALIEPALLVIDEVGATKPTEFELAVLFAVINGRYEEQRPTIVLSNLPVMDLERAVGARAWDRLREGGVIALPFNWKSARGTVEVNDV
jgi:DNA replication protein DnaC